MDNNSNSIKLPSSQFKGVVPQPNGRWGAQIYEKHQRVWLGTFNEESEAAKAYDIAAQRFRGLDAATNFHPLDRADATDAVELRFLNSHSKAEVVDMHRKHSYQAELEDFRRKGEEWRGTSSVAMMTSSIFEKTVTPSDVGKLNRLVIPKQHAERHFPLEAGESSKGRLLNLEDEEGKVWRFRYSYWNSSQSYVITKGWSHFVKEKRLKAGDVVSFHRSVGPDQKLFITWKQSNVAGDDDGACSSNAGPVRPVEMVRLFGVNIAKNDGDD